MDGLSIITGIAITSFLLLYLSFSIEKEHSVLKMITIFAAVFILLFIPQATVELDKDCSILNNGTYTCYYSNGTQVSSYNNNNVGTNFMSSYMTYLWIFGLYVFVYLTYRVLIFLGLPLDNIKWRKQSARKL